MKMPELDVRLFQDDSDFPVLQTIINESSRADQIDETVSLDDARDWFAPSARFNPHSDLLLAFGRRQGGHAAGYGRVRWYTGCAGVRLYCQTANVLPEWRDGGLWALLIQRNERRLREIATGLPPAPLQLFQAWATSSQKAWIAALRAEDYQAVRHFNNMLHRLEAIPVRPLPAGLDMRPVQPQHMRLIWEAQREVQVDLFEVVMESWTEDQYQSWAADRSHTPNLWQVAWQGDQVAGMILNRINVQENQALSRRRGFTEHIFVRRPWRQRGLAGALLCNSLNLLKSQGMEEAELGVDSENASGAFGFYQRMGYRTYSIDIWFRKPFVG